MISQNTHLPMAEPEPEPPADGEVAELVRKAAINAKPGHTIPAALRAAADQVKPSQQNYDEAPHELAKVFLNDMAYAANELRCLADELDPRSENA